MSHYEGRFKGRTAIIKAIPRWADVINMTGVFHSWSSGRALHAEK
jgi:hypothetical protein